MSAALFDLPTDAPPPTAADPIATYRCACCGATPTLKHIAKCVRRDEPRAT